MGIEFRLGRQDHHKVEDFLGSRPGHIDGIWIEAGNIPRQATVIEQARANGIGVLIDPMTERLADVGYSPSSIPYAKEAPLDLGRLARNKAHRDRLVEAVLAVQSDATISTPPHFYVTDADSAALNIALAASTIDSTDVDTRAILLARREYLAGPEVATDLARRYADIGVTALNLRLTPLGTDAEGARKVRSAYDIVNAFGREGITVTLGYQGLLGQTALALGIVSGFSVGIGMRESVNHADAIASQRKPKDKDSEFFGAQPGIWLPGAETAVPRRVAQALLTDSRIRSRLACNLGSCSRDIGGPLSDARTHYLHSRVQEITVLLSRPAAWRAAQEESRLRRAIEMRVIVNGHLPATINGAPVHPIKTRTLEVLLAEIQWRQQALSA